jgi:RND superfamily putative drug exporter
VRERFAAAVIAARWGILVAWAAAAVACTVWLPTLEEAQTGALGDLVPAESAAVDAEQRSAELFGFPLLSRTLIVQRDPEGLQDAATARVIGTAVAINRGTADRLGEIRGALPVLNVVGSQPFAREQGTTALTYLFFGPETGPVRRTELARRLAEQRLERPGDAFVGVTGALPARRAQAETIVDALPLVELCTVLLVVIAVGVHYRAVAAPLLCLAAIAVSYLVSVRLIAWLGERIGVSVPQEVEPVIVVLIFGVVTDYAIFFLSRFRRLLVEDPDPRSAARATTAGLVGIIVTAGLAVAAGGASLVVAELGFFRAFGPGLAMAVLIALLVVITLIPAALAVLGPALFWPRRPGRELPVAAAAEETGDESTGRPLRTRLARLAADRPGLVVATSSLVLVAAASGVLRLDVGQTLIRGLPEGDEARVAYESAAQGFAPGILSPTMIVVEGPGVAVRERAALRRLQALLERRRGVAETVGPREQPLRLDLGAVYSATGDAARYLVVLDSDPLGARAIADLRRIRGALPRLVEQAGLPAGTRVSIAGDTALAEETVSRAGSDLARIAPVTLLAVTLVVAVFLRALVAPLYLVAASVLALAASLGLTTYLFQDLLEHGELTYYVPFAAAVLLVSLGSDYNVFLTGRIWQEARVRPLRDAVAVGGARAAAAITVAGVVLALSFALLAIVPLQPFRELAFAMCAGLLLDAFVVRTLLVPALIALVGPVSAWPGGALRAERAQRARVPAPAAPRPASPAPRAVAERRPPSTALVVLVTLAGALLIARRRRPRAGRPAAGTGRRPGHRSRR